MREQENALSYTNRQDSEWDNADRLLSFTQAIFGTAQNYRDIMQANLPSYRERIVQIRLNEDEGGLNLAMPKDKPCFFREDAPLPQPALRVTPEV